MGVGGFRGCVGGVGAPSQLTAFRLGVLRESWRWSLVAQSVLSRATKLGGLANPYGWDW